MPAECSEPVAGWPLERFLESAARNAEEAAAQLARTLEHELERDIAVVVNQGQGWQPVAGHLEPAKLEPSAVAEPGDSACLCWLEPVTVAGLKVSVVTAAKPIDPLLLESTRRGCVWVGLHLQNQAAAHEASDISRETDVLRAVSEQLRSPHDLDQVLLSITHSTLELLVSDICGVLIREGDMLVMRSCVGHEVAETSRLRMRRGQGVAGMVFETGKPGKVDDYLADGTISQDFFTLAEQENTRSALAVPLVLREDVIGVLEVWRRRASCFTDRDVQRIVTLADFASIAIDNATLYAEQHTMLDELEETRSALQGEVEVSRSTARLQKALLDAVLDAPTLASVARVVASELDCHVGIYGPDGSLASYNGPQGAQPGPTRVPEAVTLRRTRGVVRSGDGQDAVWQQPITVDGQVVGGIALVGVSHGEEVVRIACTQVALACSLAHVQQHAASRARAEALDQALWDLLEGPLEQRTAARGRIHQMGVYMGGGRQVLLGSMRTSGIVACSDPPRHRTSVLRALRHGPASGCQDLIGMRENEIVAIVPTMGGDQLRALVGEWDAALRELGATSGSSWGASGAGHGAADLERAYREARMALTAATRMGLDTVSLFDELGIVRLLLGTGSEPDVQSFTTEVTGPLVAYDREHDGSLILTLRAFFDANCSQKNAAALLFVHHKTMRYRLERIKQLTGLDLSRHHDRVRADIALRILQMSGGGHLAAPSDGPER